MAVQFSLPACAGIEVQDVLKKADTQPGQHLHAFQDFRAIEARRRK